MLPRWLLLLGGLEPPALTVQAGGSWAVGQVPPFWEAERDRLQGEAGLVWAPGERARLGIQIDGYRLDLYGDGVRQHGPGDITMTTDLWLWRGPIDLGAGFSVKQPNADDERELGSDEADVALMGRLGLEQTVRLEVAAGVRLAGDPHRFTSHDTIPELALSAALPTGWGAVRLVGGGGLATADNPARLTLRAGVVSACPLRLSIDGLIGLTAAAPDWGAQASIGYCHG